MKTPVTIAEITLGLLAHLILTRKLVGSWPATLLAGIAPDAPFHLTYPAWVIRRRQLSHALAMGDWPDPPHWMETAHHAFHSIPVALAIAAFARLVQGRWPRELLTAWLLHILVDIPTHSRRHWGPRFLWPLSDVAVDGVSWAEVVAGLARMVIHGPTGRNSKKPQIVALRPIVSVADRIYTWECPESTA